MRAPNACILNDAGINCNEETGFAFTQAGAVADQVHISLLQGGERNLQDYQILVLPGGFSHGDAIQAGKTLGLEIEKTLADQMNGFVEKGGLVLGICNGFQVLTRTGLLPHGRIDPDAPKPLSLVHNNSGKFVDRWQHLRTEQNNRCLFAQRDGEHGLDEYIELPVANGEGRLVSRNTTAMADQLALDGLVVFRYITQRGVIEETGPDNPSGSLFGIAGVCDQSGQVLGLMPHPERFVDRTQHPNWRRGEGQVPYGALIIGQMVDVARTA